MLLLGKEAEDFLAGNKINVVPRAVAKTESEVISKARKIGFPVVLKVSSKELIHKTEKGAVKVDIRNEAELRVAYKELKGIKSEGFLIQKFIPGDWFLVGLKKDPSFGHVLAFGLGGIYTEALKDVSFRICPVSSHEVDSMVKETKAFKILSGARGKKYDISAVKSLLLNISKLSNKYPNILELDINPLIVNSKQAVVVDARVILD